MPTENPYETTQVNERVPDEPSVKSVPSDRAAYNVVADTVTGLNIRKSDNWFQAVFIGSTMLVLAATGAFAAALVRDWNLPWYAGALIGSFLGLIVGVLGSGTYLMIYRAARHLKGQHD